MKELHPFVRSPPISVDKSNFQRSLINGKWPAYVSCSGTLRHTQSGTEPATFQLPNDLLSQRPSPHCMQVSVSNPFLTACIRKLSASGLDSRLLTAPYAPHWTRMYCVRVELTLDILLSQSKGIRVRTDRGCCSDSHRAARRRAGSWVPGRAGTQR